MKLTRIIFIALAVMLPTTWTIAQATDEAAPAEGKKEKKPKKGKKEEGAPAEGEKK